MEIYEGDIFEIDTAVGKKQVMIVAVHENYVSTLGLYDSKTSECCVRVSSKQVMYADAGKLGFVAKERLMDFVKAVSSNELDAIKEEIAKGLNLTVGVAPKLEIKPTSIDTERVKLEAERDVYKKLYEDMLGRMIG